jgi:hypothetical protein
MRIYLTVVFLVIISVSSIVLADKKLGEDTKLIGNNKLIGNHNALGNNKRIANIDATIAGEYYIIKISDYSGKEELKMFTGEDFETFKKDLDVEDKLYDKAQMLTRNKWQSDSKNESVAYPAASITKKAYTVMSRQTDYNKARAKLAELIARDNNEKKAKSQKDALVSRYKNRNPGNPQKEALGKKACALFVTVMKELVDARVTTTPNDISAAAGNSRSVSTNAPAASTNAPAVEIK